MAVPDIDTLRSVIRYDPDTGYLWWKFRDWATPQWNGKHANTRGFTSVDSWGYYQGHTQWGMMKAHRVAWALTFGAWPVNQIDHINGVVTDNRIENLRSARPIDNGKNRKKPENNSSGYKGVSWHRPLGKWRAAIGFNNRKKHLGYFFNIEDAAAAYRAAADKHHGEFVREPEWE